MNKRNYINRSTLFWLLLFTPLIATADGQGDVSAIAEKQTGQTPPTLSELIYDSSEHFTDINSANLNGLLERIGDSRLVLLGEATHGSAEFYDMRARITRELIEKKGFNIIAVEADWPDATSINFYIRGTNNKPEFKDKPFSGFPSWMWANHSVIEFTHWLKDYNHRFNSTEGTERFKRSVGFYGIDIYNMYGSIDAVLNYLQDIDPKEADVARWRYGCLKPWAAEPSLYSHVMQLGRYHHCGYEVHAVLQDLRKKRDLYSQTNKQTDEQRYFNAEQNAKLVTNGELYFRTLYYDNNNIRNQRDENMFGTLQAILNYHGQSS
ncbi:MAG: protein-L-isoaspartate O-methyltransferase, partial [Gammaproteobacteria bacterium]|nr:protein-L-isoaspartate O-methyltransferase [Gammaproteobacteria bacterium]